MSCGDEPPGGPLKRVCGGPTRTELGEEGRAGLGKDGGPWRQSPRAQNHSGKDRSFLEQRLAYYLSSYKGSPGQLTISATLQCVRHASSGASLVAPAVRNPPVNAGATALIPGPGGSRMSQGHH